MEIAIPSYGRPLVTTKNYFTEAKIYIPKKQEQDYLQNYKAEDLIVVPDDRDGSASKKRNAILDFSTDDYIVMVDDDFQGINTKIFDKTQFLGALEVMFQMTEDLQIPLFGFNPSSDPLKSPNFQPFSLIKPVYGLIGINKKYLKNRYDEELYAHEDLDFALQVLYNHGLILRDNRISFKFGKNVGGGVDYSNPKRVDSTLRMKKKWGNKFLKFDNLSITGVRSPLAGV